MTSHFHSENNRAWRYQFYSKAKLQYFTVENVIKRLMHQFYFYIVTEVQSRLLIFLEGWGRLKIEALKIMFRLVLTKKCKVGKDGGMEGSSNATCLCQMITYSVYTKLWTHILHPKLYVKKHISKEISIQMLKSRITFIDTCRTYVHRILFTHSVKCVCCICNYCHV
jgi:hypothetical protein